MVGFVTISKNYKFKDIALKNRKLMANFSPNFKFEICQKSEISRLEII